MKKFAIDAAGTLIFVSVIPSIFLALGFKSLMGDSFSRWAVIRAENLSDRLCDFLEGVE